MEANPSNALLVEAAMLITATRLRIARSMTLIGKVTLDGVSLPRTSAAAHRMVAPRTPSSPPIISTQHH